MTKIIENKSNMVKSVAIDNPNAFMKDMIASIEALKEIYIIENEALDNSDIDRFLALQDEKANIAKRYQKQHLIILNNKDDMSEIDSNLKNKLEEMRADFIELARINQKKLERAKKTTKRLCERIMEVAKENIEKKQMRYGAGGKVHKRKTNISVGIYETA